MKIQTYYTMQELEEYAEGTSSVLLYATLNALSLSSTEHDHISSHVGKAYGLVQTALSITNDQKCIPQELLSKNALTQSDLHNRYVDENVGKSIVFEICAQARLHVSEAKKLYGKGNESSKIKSILLPSIIYTNNMLSLLHNNDYNVNHLKSRQQCGWTPLQMLYYLNWSTSPFQ